MPAQATWLINASLTCPVLKSHPGFCSSTQNARQRRNENRDFKIGESKWERGGRQGGRGRWGKREREEEKITKLVLSNRCNTKIKCTGIKPARPLQVLGVLECANTLIWNALMSHRSRVRFLIPLPTFLSRNFTSQKQIFKKKKQNTPESSSRICEASFCNVKTSLAMHVFPNWFIRSTLYLFASVLQALLQGKWVCLRVYQLLWLEEIILGVIRVSGGSSSASPPPFWLFKFPIQGPMGVQEDSNPFISRTFSLIEKYPYYPPPRREDPMPWKFAMCMQSASDDQIVNLQLAWHLPCSFTCQTNAHWAESACQALSCSGRRGRKVWSLSSKNSHVQQTEAEGSRACTLCWGICLEQAALRPNMALALSPRSGLHFLPETDTPLSN